MSVTTSPQAPSEAAPRDPVAPRRSLIPAPLRNPWGQPRFLVGAT